jgi:cytochrome P450
VHDNKEVMQSLIGGPPLWKYISVPKLKEMRRYLDYFYSYTVHRLESLDIEEGTLISHMNLQEVNDERKGGKASLSKEQSLSILWELVRGSFDSFASTFAFLLYNMAKNPEPQEKLRQEIQENRAKMATQELFATLHHGMPYLSATMKERWIPGSGGWRVGQQNNNCTVTADTAAPWPSD